MHPNILTRTSINTFRFMGHLLGYARVSVDDQDAHAAEGLLVLDGRLPGV